MTLTDYATKTATTWGEILPADILDGYTITRVQRNNAGDCVRVYFFGGGGWSAWQPATRLVSVWR